MDQYSPQGRGRSPDLLADRLQRIRRVVGFAGTRVRAVRRDHEAFWLVGAEQAPPLGPGQAERVTQFVRKADLALRLVEAGEALLAEAQAQPPVQALVTSGRFDPEQLAATVRELDALLPGVQAAAIPYGARAMDLPVRQAPAPAAGGPAAGAQARPHAAPQGGSGPLSRWLQKIVDGPKVVASAAGAPPAAPPPKADPLAAYLAALEGGVETIKAVLAEVSTELLILRVALVGTALPVPRRPWPEVPDALQAAAERDKLDPVQHSWLVPVAKRLYMDDQAVRRAHVAVTQWLDARQLIVSAQRQRLALGGAAPDRQKAMMADFHPGKLRAAILPLTHLHATFAGTPVISRLFPPPGSL